MTLWVSLADFDLNDLKCHYRLMLNVVKVQILSFQALFCDKYFCGMIVYGAVYSKVVKSICI